MSNKAAVIQFKFNTLEIDGKSYVFLGIEKNNLIDLINAESKANKSVFEKILKKQKQRNKMYYKLAIT